jgi:uncharacterized protein with beta-barrel porin domain
MLMAAAAGYGRRAYAACVNTVGSTYQCSGANLTTQNVNGPNANNADVSTVAGFSVNAGVGNAITISGDGGLSYTDTNASPLRAATGYALDVRSHGDFAGTPGSVTINTNGALSGNSGIYAATYLGGTGALTITTNGNVLTSAVNARGIFARNSGTGALTITANGNISSPTGVGIYARNYGTALTVTTGAGTTVSGFYGVYVRNLAGTGALTITANGDVTGTRGGISAKSYASGLTVTTGAGTTVHGGAIGISARNFGTGAVTITANGDVTGTTGDGIDTYNSHVGTNLTVTTGAGTTVSGRNTGIYAHNLATGAVTVTANGDVNGTTGNGIDAYNSHLGTNLTVTTGAGTTVSGGNTGIRARNFGAGALTITANGNVNGTSGSGIMAQNYGTDVTVTTGGGTTVGGTGIFARNDGSGALTVTASGNVTGTIRYGIYAANHSTGTVLSVTAGAGTTVSGATDGILANNSGTGVLSITVNGNVRGAQRGIYASSGSAMGITVAATGTVTSTGTAATDFAIQTISGPATIMVAGTVNGGAGGAVQFDQTGAFANRLELVTGAAVNGNVLGGLGSDTLGLSGTGSGSFNVGQLVSFEAGQKTGTGSWTLTGANSGITTFSVGGGALFVNGSLGNAAFTVSGGTLGGTGAVGNTQVNAGATFAPGSSTPGTFMTVNGTLGLDAAATYAVHLNSTTLSFANVSGTATLSGATVNAIFADEVSRQYTILTAGTRNGTFGTLTNTNLPANFHDTLSYDGTHAFLNLTLAFQTDGLNGNQQTVANLVTNFFSHGSIPLVLGGLTANGLSQASGESATGSQQTTFNAMNQFMGVMTDPFIDGRGDGVSAGETTATGYASTQKTGTSRDAYAMFTKVPPVIAFEQRWSVWAAGYGGSQTTDGNAALGSNSATSRLAGTAVGADYRISPFTIAGFALAGGGTSFSVNGMGSGRSDLFQAGAFVRHTVGPAYLSGALAYGWQDITTDRTVTAGGIDRLHAEFNANAYSGRVEGGYRFVSPWIGGIGITPYAAGQFTTFDLPAYAEQAIAGSNIFALAYGAKSVTDTRSELGLRGDKSYAVQDGIFTLRSRFAWAHDFNPDRAIGATFQALPGASFVVNGARQASDSALTTASAEMKWMNGWSTAATFEGEFSSVTRSYAGKGVVRYIW